jgi:hypothetical protein
VLDSGGGVSFSQPGLFPTDLALGGAAFYRGVVILRSNFLDIGDVGWVSSVESCFDVG